MTKHLSLARYIFSSPDRTSAFLFSSVPLWVILIFMIAGTLKPLTGVFLMLIVFMSRAVVNAFVNKGFFVSFLDQIMASIFKIFTLFLYSVLIFVTAFTLAFSDGFWGIGMIIFTVVFIGYYILVLSPRFGVRLWNAGIRPVSTAFYDFMIALIWVSILFSTGNKTNVIFLILLLIIFHFKKIMKIYESVL